MNPKRFKKLEANQFKSSQSQDFKDMVQYLLDKYGKVMLLIWWTNQGGSRDYWIITDLEEYDSLTKGLKPGDFVLVFRELSTVWRGIVDDSTLDKLKQVIQGSEERNFFAICVNSIEEERTHREAKDYSFCHWRQIETLEELEEEIPEYIDIEIIFMLDPDHWDDSNVYFAYHPDEDGYGYSQGAY